VAVADNQRMVIVHGTQRFRDRVPAVPASTSDRSTTLLGSWYATLLRRRPQVALFVNERTLVPVFVPLAPARTLLRRLPAAIADVLAAHKIPRQLIDSEVAEMDAPLVAPTTSRSLVGVMTEFGHLADTFGDDQVDDLVGLAVRLAATPCSPLYGRHISPNHELAALVADQVGR
jgi:hypothetical protein